MRVEQVDEVCMGAVDDKVEAKCLHKDLLRSEDLARNFLNLLEGEGGGVGPTSISQVSKGKRTGPLSEMSRTSTPFAFAWHTLATSLSFLPHSSVLVARNMQAAAMV